MSESDKGKWEKKTKEEINRNRYRFTGERYGLRGTTHNGPSDWIPQKSGLYAFPKSDTTNIDDDLS